MPSPVQPGRNQPWLIFVGAGIAALIAWSYQQDWGDPPAPGEVRSVEQVERVEPVERVELPLPPRDTTASPAVELRPIAPTAPAIRAKANLAALFSTDDYPSAALRKGEQGRVAARLAIDPRGRVAACRIDQSSGSAALDRATCSIIQARARFTPARDAAGRSVTDTSTVRIKWVLPED